MKKIKRIKRIIKDVSEIVVVGMISYSVPTVLRYIVGGGREQMLGRLALVLAAYIVVGFTFSLMFLKQKA